MSNNNFLENYTPELPKKEKYRFGKSKHDRLNEIKDHKPVFAFDYIALGNSKNDKYTFDSTHVKQKCYNKLFSSLKKLSDKTYDELSKDKAYHFHPIDFDDYSNSESNFIKCINNNNCSQEHKDQMPTVFQFKVFEEARLVGFISNSIFYLVWFDRLHKGYERK